MCILFAVRNPQEDGASITVGGKQVALGIPSAGQSKAGVKSSKYGGQRALYDSIYFSSEKAC